MYSGVRLLLIKMYMLADILFTWIATPIAEIVRIFRKLQFLFQMERTMGALSVIPTLEARKT